MLHAAIGCTPEESSDEIQSSDHSLTSSHSPPSTCWNFLVLFMLFLLSLSILLDFKSVSNNRWEKVFIHRSPWKVNTPPTLRLNPSDFKPDTSPNELQTNNDRQKALIAPQPNVARNIKVIVAAITLEVLGALAIKFLVPTVPITSILAGLMTTRRVRFLAKLKQWLLFLPKIARFEKKFKKISMTLKTLQKGLKSVYSQQKHEEEFEAVS